MFRFSSLHVYLNIIAACQVFMNYFYIISNEGRKLSGVLLAEEII
jgi:hypothetical protein